MRRLRIAAWIAPLVFAAACATTAPPAPPREPAPAEKPSPKKPGKKPRPAPKEPSAPKEPGAAPAPQPGTVEAAVAKFGPAAEARLQPQFERAGIPYPPKRIHLLAFKEEKLLELWADSGAGPRFVRWYPVLAASGRPGPKLREGDLQVPEGVYSATLLNPQSSYHLSIGLNYPNSFDRARADQEDRDNLGGDIFIHGRDQSIGCLAMGDPAIEELFVLAAKVGIGNVNVVIAPNDLRSKTPPGPERLRYAPEWLPQLYSILGTALARFTR